MDYQNLNKILKGKTMKKIIMILLVFISFSPLFAIEVIDEIYINKDISIIDGGSYLLSLNDLKNNQVLIRGNAETEENEVFSVLYRLNGSAWQLAKGKKNWSFVLPINQKLTEQRIELDIKALDSVENESEIVSFALLYKNIDYKRIAKNTLDSLKEAYLNKNKDQFLTYISPDFMRDKQTLEEALKTDFDAVTINRLWFYYRTIIIRGKQVIVKCDWKKKQTLNTNGQIQVTKGHLIFYMQKDREKLSIINWRGTPIFGFTDPNMGATIECN
jgi:hypothetical protein